MDFLQNRFWRYLGAIALITALQFSFIRLLHFLQSLMAIAVMPFWFPAGLAIALIWYFGRRFVPAIGLSAFLVAAPVMGVPYALIAGAIDALQTWVGVTLLKQHHFNPHLERLRDVRYLFLFGALAPSAISATLGTLNLQLFTGFDWSPIPSTWFRWFLGNVTGTLILLPVLLTLGKWRTVIKNWQRLAEMALWLGIQFLGYWLAYLSMDSVPFVAQWNLRALLPFPLIIWGALRLGQPGASLAIAIITGFTFWEFLVLNQLVGGTQAATQSLDKFVSYQLEICAFVLIALTLASVMTERQWARQQSEELLLKILPSPIANRLKSGQQTIADSFAEVTVMFADIVNFTQLAATLTPEKIVVMLNEIFSEFDRLAEQHGLEKIKTIGDAYMVVGGLPVPRDDHAEAIAAMALDMQVEIARFRDRHQQPFDMRIGVNTGPVVAGVIGKKKFLYDLWGDTVNIASRMESSGVPGQIQVTEATYRRLQHAFRFEPRGMVHVKGRGDMMTYFLKQCQHPQAPDPSDQPSPSSLHNLSDSAA